MALKKFLFDTDTDRAVDRWLKEVLHSIDEVIRYRITRGVDDLPIIELTMYYQEPERKKSE